MQDHLPEVRIVNGRVVTAPGAMVWLPQDGQVIAKIPPMKVNKRWLRQAVRIRSRTSTATGGICLVRLVTAAVDRYGYIVVCRDMSKLSRCTRACLEATGIDCNCSCLGARHGQDSGGWFERVGDVMVADCGEVARAVLLYGAKGDDADTVVYDGELSGRRYRADRAGGRGWPTASRFMCAGCMSARAHAQRRVMVQVGQRVDLLLGQHRGGVLARSTRMPDHLCGVDRGTQHADLHAGEVRKHLGEKPGAVFGAGRVVQDSHHAGGKRRTASVVQRHLVLAVSPVPGLHPRPDPAPRLTRELTIPSLN